jgi:error-prone DNA polymerase
VKDAQRHGLKVRPIDVSCSEWNCTLESEANTAASSTLAAPARQVSGHDLSRAVKASFLTGALAPAKAIALRIGLRYVRGLQQAAAEALIEERRRRPFASTEDLALRVPQLSRANLAMLARIGALNQMNPDTKLHRRDALWQIEKAARKVGPLLESVVEADTASPLYKMEVEERLVADYHGTGITVGPHPMAYQRSALRRMGILSAAELRESPHGKQAMVAGSVITRQRPGTAKGLIFITLEDETGNSNIIVMPDLYSSDPLVVLHERFLKVKGVVQNQDGIVHLKAQKIMPLKVTAAEMQSHDFH